MRFQKKICNSKNLIVQHLPVKERVKKTKSNRIRNGFILDTLTSADIQEIVNIGGKVIDFYAGVFYRGIYKKSPFIVVIQSN